MKQALATAIVPAAAPINATASTISRTLIRVYGICSVNYAIPIAKTSSNTSDAIAGPADRSDVFSAIPR